MILPVLTVLLAVLVSGAVLHCVLAVIASAAYRRRRPEPSRDMPFLSVLKPLAGDEEGLREDLRCIFEQEYPEFEVLLSVADGADPAWRSVARFRRSIPKHIPRWRPATFAQWPQRPAMTFW